MSDNTKRIALQLAIVQCVVAALAIPSGLSLVLDPSGSGIGLPLEVLEHSPFQDYFIPGLFLFLFNGLLNAAGAILSFRRSKYTGAIGLGLGAILLLWILIQVYLTGLVHFLQPLFFLIALIELNLGRRFYMIETAK